LKPESQTLESIWKKNGQRAPHKPLLILYALGQLVNQGKLRLPYEEVREELKALLIEFGPIRKSYHPEEPFVRLARDGFWEVDAAPDLSSPNDKKLLLSHASGGFSDAALNLLQSDRALVYELAHGILEEHFPDTMHEDILERVGLTHLVFKNNRNRPRPCEGGRSSSVWRVNQCFVLSAAISLRRPLGGG